MAEIIQEYATDPTTGETIAVDPPLQPSDAPLVGNPILTRRAAPRRANSNTALYASAAVAMVAVLAGGAYLIASGVHQRSDLVTNTETAPSAEQQAAATTSPGPVMTPSQATAPIVASADTPEQPLRPMHSERAEVRAVRHAEHRAVARAADEQGADASANVAPQGQPAPAPVVATPAPIVASPAPASEAAPASPPVITPPPAQ